ncbi:hypothetical protein D7D52_34730 [Nocardia yunnanensis]|uniref:Uncharacterized protein n=1 Tax=Nocardia yunnanensis TaxID=2382165 RepID=A0A386ZN52_9NOCA|nr:hypothetical protein [Nocardia yunnanensis]AYF78129.1 hypothetical protein D7D52_34730 [Nocardia yunnanensis]
MQNATAVLEWHELGTGTAIYTAGSREHGELSFDITKFGSTWDLTAAKWSQTAYSNTGTFVFYGDGIASLEEAKEMAELIARAAWEMDIKRGDIRLIDGELTIDGEPAAQWLKAMFED